LKSASVQPNTKFFCKLVEESAPGLHGQESTPSHYVLETSFRFLPSTIPLQDAQVRLSSLMCILEERPLLRGVERAEKANASPQRIWRDSGHPLWNGHRKPSPQSQSAGRGERNLIASSLSRQTYLRANQLSSQESFNQGIDGARAAAPLRARRIPKHLSDCVGGGRAID